MKIKVRVGEVTIEYSENQQETDYLTIVSGYEYPKDGGMPKGDHILKVIKEIADKAADIERGMNYE